MSELGRDGSAEARLAPRERLARRLGVAWKFTAAEQHSKVRSMGIWALTCLFLVWVGFKVWALILTWHVAGIQWFQIVGQY